MTEVQATEHWLKALTRSRAICSCGQEMMLEEPGRYRADAERDQLLDMFNAHKRKNEGR